VQNTKNGGRIKCIDSAFKCENIIVTDVVTKERAKICKCTPYIYIYIHTHTHTYIYVCVYAEPQSVLY
jgi:hypothetical protein